MVGTRQDSSRISRLRGSVPGLPRKRPFRTPRESEACVRKRFDSLAVAFLADTRPGLIFERGRLAFANDAARDLLGSAEASDDFLNALGRSVECRVIEPCFTLHAVSGVYAPILHSSPNRQKHPTCTCFLIKRSEAAPACRGLSDRQLDVVRLLVKGLTNQEIADGLGISIETVRKHVSKALEKTSTRNRAGLVAKALSR